MKQMPYDDLLVRVSRVSEKGLVQIPLEIREKLDLQLGTKMIIMTTEDAVVLRKAELLFAREPSTGLLKKNPHDVLQGTNKEHRGIESVGRDSWQRQKSLKKLWLNN